MQILRNRQAWVGVVIALFTSQLVITSWQIYRMNWILSQGVLASPSLQLADKLEKLKGRLDARETVVSPAADHKLVRAVVTLQISDLRRQPSSYDYEIYTSRSLFYLSLAVFAVQLVLAFTAFLPARKSSSPPAAAENVLSNST